MTGQPRGCRPHRPQSEWGFQRCAVFDSLSDTFLAQTSNLNVNMSLTPRGTHKQLLAGPHESFSTGV